jgi:hypothetical protein
MDLPGIRSIDLEKEQAKYVFNNIPDVMPFLHPAGLNLLQSFFMYDPNVRIDATAALQHDYFLVSPLPQLADLMPTFRPSHPSIDDENE